MAVRALRNSTSCRKKVEGKGAQHSWRQQMPQMHQRPPSLVQSGCVRLGFSNTRGLRRVAGGAVLWIGLAEVLALRCGSPVSTFCNCFHAVSCFLHAVARQSGTIAKPAPTRTGRLTSPSSGACMPLRLAPQRPHPPPLSPAGWASVRELRCTQQHTFATRLSF